jgi:hypothetical protein
LVWNLRYVMGRSGAQQNEFPGIPTIERGLEFDRSPRQTLPDDLVLIYAYVMIAGRRIRPVLQIDNRFSDLLEPV